MVDNYTVQQLAEHLQVHENTIYDWLEKKVFPRAFKIQKGWRIPREDVERAKRYDFEPPALPDTKAPISLARKSSFVTRW